MRPTAAGSFSFRKALHAHDGREQKGSLDEDWESQKMCAYVIEDVHREPSSSGRHFISTGIPAEVMALRRLLSGDIADALERWYIAQGGFLRKADLAAHKTRVEDPVHTGYQGYTVYKCGPWTQGPYLLQTLRLLEGFDIKGLGFLSADYIHVITEAMKLGLADRDEYYADPLFVRVPMKALLSDSYTRIRRPLIDVSKASLQVRPRRS
jgi:gamma-glutamyltranspeptidase